jgi:hypothetical protein
MKFRVSLNTWIFSEYWLVFSLPLGIYIEEDIVHSKNEQEMGREQGCQLHQQVTKRSVWREGCRVDCRSLIPDFTHKGLLCFSFFILLFLFGKF